MTQTKSLGPSGSPTGTATTTYVYDANDRLETETLSLSGTVPGATAGTTTYTFDAAGNTTKKVSPTETIDYVYDDANRLAELQTLAGDVTRYTYAHDGTRLSQTRDATGANPVTTHYLVDPNHAYAQVIEEAEQQGSGAPTLKALYAVGDDRIRRYTPAVAGSGGGPSIPAGLRYYHADGLGSTRLLTDDTAAITDQLTYEAFGELDAAASAQTSNNAFMYTGEQFDPNAGFYYLRARYMNPGNGRFTQQDGFAGFGSDPITLHKYLYANTSPVNFTDPSGRYSLLEAQVTSTIANTLAQLQIENSFDVFDYAGVGDNQYIDGARTAMKVIGIAALAASGVKIATLLSKKAAAMLAKNAAKKVESNPQVIALGLGDHLDEFTHVVNGKSWKQWAKDDPLNWKRAFNDVVNNADNKVAFNLTGVDSAWGAVQRASTGKGGATDWELMMIKTSPEWWPRITWYRDGLVVANPFE